LSQEIRASTSNVEKEVEEATTKPTTEYVIISRLFGGLCKSLNCQ
jgi:hypothetical protein